MNKINNFKHDNSLIGIKIFAIFSAILSVILGAFSIVGRMFFLNNEDIAQIGGVSGPEEVYVTEQSIPIYYYNDTVGKIAIVFAVIFLAIVTFLLIKSGKKKKAD